MQIGFARCAAREGLMKRIAGLSFAATPPLGKAAVILLLMILHASGCASKNEKALDLRGKVTRCEIHQVDLLEETRDDVRMTISWTPDFEKAMKSRFPHLGLAEGNAATSGIPGKVKVRYCPRCREARNQWVREHEKPGRP